MFEYTTPMKGNNGDTFYKENVLQFGRAYIYERQ